MIFGGLLKKLIPGKVKQFLFDKAVDGALSRLGKWIKARFSFQPTPNDQPTLPSPKEKEIIGPKTKFNTGRLDWREIENQKPNKKKGK